uniref:Uncharacterized protein n=1 Tax=Gorilla gorilla gorilla TaxID=9595 RepID=A0A2I2Z0T6_GORGO
MRSESPGKWGNSPGLHHSSTGKSPASSLPGRGVPELRVTPTAPSAEGGRKTAPSHGSAHSASPPASLSATDPWPLAAQTLSTPRRTSTTPMGPAAMSTPAAGAPSASTDPAQRIVVTGRGPTPLGHAAHAQLAQPTARTKSKFSGHL